MGSLFLILPFYFVVVYHGVVVDRRSQRRRLSRQTEGKLVALSSIWPTSIPCSRPCCLRRCTICRSPRTGTRRPSLSAADSIPQDAQLRPPLPPLITAADTGGALSITARSAGAFLPEPVSFLTTCYLLSFILTKSKVITYNISVNNNVLLFVFCLIFHKSVCF